MTETYDHTPMYRDGRHYDLQHEDQERDLEFYQHCARTYGAPVLELACGTGRVSIPLARAGHAVTGVDVSDGMLAEARRKSELDSNPPQWVQADVRGFSLTERFALVMYPFNSMAHLHERGDVERCFARVREHLLPNGRFVVAFFNPRMDLLARPGSEVREIARYADPDTGDEVVVTESARYDAATQINHVTWRYEIGGEPRALRRLFGGKRGNRAGATKFIEHALNMRIFFPQELESLLHYNGFAVEEKYGDFDRSPFRPDGPHQLIVARCR